MNHANFHIGLEFIGSAGFRWRCTDIGTRTILAIQLDRDDDPNGERERNRPAGQQGEEDRSARPQHLSERHVENAHR